MTDTNIPADVVERARRAFEGPHPFGPDGFELALIAALRVGVEWEREQSKRQIETAELKVERLRESLKEIAEMGPLGRVDDPDAVIDIAKTALSADREG